MEKELYILGLILTDGYKYEKYWRIELKDEDKNVLEDIANIYHCGLYHRTRDTNFAKNYSSTILEIRDKELISFLNIYCPQKDKTFLANIPKEYLLSPSLWRGILDGDGSYGYRQTGNKKTPFIGFVTINENFKEGFCYVVKHIIGQEIEATRNQRDGVYNLGITSVNAKKFIQWLLQPNTFYIQRKKEKMDSINNWQPTGRQGMTYKRWTKEEDDFVYTHTTSECLKELNRTSDAIKNRKTKLNRE